MKKLLFIVFILPLGFLGNATKSDLPKKDKIHIVKNAKTQALKTGKTHVRKNLLLAGRKISKASSFFDYCITYEWQGCGLSNPVPLSSCYARLEDAYSWSLFMYNLNVDYLSQCPEPE